IRPDVVFFGEPLPQEALQKAIEYSERADLMIVMGSSLVVYPAAYLPMITVENGGKLVIVNKGETGLDNIAFKKYDMDLVEFSRKILEVI
ncbi:MAG: NAD-dependent protein deacylase, partial [Thermotogaceae bacterium]|nr:NAD-dependent protein deacylase [Thermotogaceae bacterium]